MTNLNGITVSSQGEITKMSLNGIIYRDSAGNVTDYKIPRWNKLSIIDQTPLIYDYGTFDYVCYDDNYLYIVVTSSPSCIVVKASIMDYTLTWNKNIGKYDDNGSTTVNTRYYKARGISVDDSNIYILVTTRYYTDAEQVYIYVLNKNAGVVTDRITLAGKGSNFSTGIFASISSNYMLHGCTVCYQDNANKNNVIKIDTNSDKKQIPCSDTSQSIDSSITDKNGNTLMMLSSGYIEVRDPSGNLIYSHNSYSNYPKTDAIIISNDDIYVCYCSTADGTNIYWDSLSSGTNEVSKLIYSSNKSSLDDPISIIVNHDDELIVVLTSLLDGSKKLLTYDKSGSTKIDITYSLPSLLSGPLMEVESSDSMYKIIGVANAPSGMNHPIITSIGSI